MTRSSGLAPYPELAAIPVGEFLYKSSDPTEIPTTRLVNSVPYCSIAAVRAAISAATPAAPPDAHKPRRRVVSEAIAAGIAEVGPVVSPCFQNCQYQ